MAFDESIHGHSCSQNKNFSPLMSINCLINRRLKETKRQRVKETKSQRVKETKSQRVKETKSQRDKESKRQRVKETKSRGLPQPLPKGKGFVAALMHRTWGAFYGVKETKRLREEERKRLKD